MTELNSAAFTAFISDAKTPALIDFWAPWCSPCRAMSPAFEKFAAENASAVRCAKVNIDENPDVAESLGIMSIPTIMLFKNGEQIKKAVGVQSPAALKAMLN